MPKFNVEVSYEVTEVYEIEAKDADFARIKATSIYPYAPIDRRVSGKRVESITQVSRRFIVEKAYAEDACVVIDTHHRQTRIAKCVSKDVAEMLADVVNARHEEEEAE